MEDVNTMIRTVGRMVSEANYERSAEAQIEEAKGPLNQGRTA